MGSMVAILLVIDLLCHRPYWSGRTPRPDWKMRHGIGTQ